MSYKPDAALSATYPAVVTEFPDTPQKHGAAGNGVTDDTAALQAFLAGGHTNGYIPAGVYKIQGSGLVPPNNMSVELHPNAVIRAADALGGAPMWQTPMASTAIRQTLKGGTFDCNGVAHRGIMLSSAQHFTLRDITVMAPTVTGFQIGATGSAATSYECMVDNVNVWRAAGAAVPAGSIGLYQENASDCEFHKVVIVGAETGIYALAGNNFSHCHVWGQANHLPTTCFRDIGGNNMWVQCFADSPSATGFRFDAGYSTLVASRCLLFAANGNVDGATNAVQLVAGPLFAFGNKFEGQSGSMRLGADYVGDLSTSVIVGQSNGYMVSPQLAGTSSFPSGEVIGQAVPLSMFVAGAITNGMYPPQSFIAPRKVHVSGVHSLLHTGGTGATTFRIARAGVDLTGDITVGSPANVSFDLAQWDAPYIYTTSAGSGAYDLTVQLRASQIN